MTNKYNVYFSASSKDGSKNSTYSKITGAIEKAGGKIIYNWLKDKVKLSPEKLFKQGLQGIEEADVMVAEITTPSTGVGQQIALALDKKIPVIALIRKGAKNTSRFTLGTSSPFLHIVEYTERDLSDKLFKEKFSQVLKQKLVKFNFIASRKIYQFIERESEKLHMSKSEYLRKVFEEKIMA